MNKATSNKTSSKNVAANLGAALLKATGGASATYASGVSDDAITSAVIGDINVGISRASTLCKWVATCGKDTAKLTALRTQIVAVIEAATVSVKDDAEVVDKALRRNLMINWASRDLIRAVTKIHGKETADSIKAPAQSNGAAARSTGVMAKAGNLVTANGEKIGVETASVALANALKLVKVADRPAITALFKLFSDAE